MRDTKQKSKATTTTTKPRTEKIHSKKERNERKNIFIPNIQTRIHTANTYLPCIIYEPYDKASNGILLINFMRSTLY